MKLSFVFGVLRKLGRIRSISIFMVICLPLLMLISKVSVFSTRNKLSVDDIIKHNRSLSFLPSFSRIENSTSQAKILIEYIINPHHFTYIHKPVKLCKGKKVFIITYIHSSPENFHKRQTIRKTWGNIKRFVKETILVVFIMGQVDDHDVMRSVKNESEFYGDIVQEDFKDSYRNLTYKAIAGLKWVSTYCSQAVYVLKTDDDIFVNWFIFLPYIQSRIEYSYRNVDWILCAVATRGEVIRNNQSKWYVSKKEHPSDVYETYCSGSAFLITPRVARKLYEVSLTTPFFWIDDIYITGHLVSKLNIRHLIFNSAYVFSSCLMAFKLDVKHNYVFYHTDTETMVFFWNNLTSWRV